MVNILFVIEFLVLYLLQARGLFGGDSAEYSIIGNTWSVAHPPGYPLYSFLLNLLRVLHFPSYMNLISMLSTVLVSFFIYKIFLLFKKDRVLALIPAVVYVFLFPIWLYSEVPEVFALNNLFIASISYLLLKNYTIDKNRPPSLLIYLLFGLAATNQQTIILFVPGWFLLMKDKIKIIMADKIYLAKAFGLFLLGFSFYLYAPIASSFNPPFDVEDAKTLSGLFRLFFRTTYGTFTSYIGSKPDLVIQILGVLSSFIYILLDFRVIGLVIILAGLVYLFKKNRGVFKFALLTIIFELVFFFYINFNLTIAFAAATYERFLISYYFILVLLFGFGLIFIDTFIKKIPIKNHHLKKIAGLFVYLFGFGFAAIIFLNNFSVIRYVKNINELDNYAKDILDNVPKGSILAATSDNSSFTVGYYYYVKKYRPDIILLSVGIFNRQYYQEILQRRYPFLNYSAFKKNDLNLFIKENSRKYQVYFETPSTTGYWAPYGLVWKYYPTEKLADADKANIIEANQKIWPHLHIPKLNSKQLNIYHLETVRDDYLGKLLSYAKYLLAYGDIDMAKKYTEKILANDPERRDAKGLLINILAKQGDCANAKSLYDGFKKNLVTTDTEELTRALSYYYYCDKNNPDLKNILREYQLINPPNTNPQSTVTR